MNHTPYGYRIELARAVIYEPEAERLRVYFNEYLVCKSMRAAGIKAGINKTHSVLARLLKCEKYVGTDFYPAIIEQSVFDEAQIIRQKNAKTQNRIREFVAQAVDDCTISFTAEKAELLHTDPYKQAEYAYGLIQEEANE